MLTPRQRFAAILLAAGAGIAVFAGAGTSDPSASDRISSLGSRSSDAVAVVLDSPGSRAPAVIRNSPKADDRITRVLKPVLMSVMPFALACVFAAWWCVCSSYRPAHGRAIALGAAPRGPPLRAS